MELSISSQSFTPGDIPLPISSSSGGRTHAALYVIAAFVPAAVMQVSFNYKFVTCIVKEHHTHGLGRTVVGPFLALVIETVAYIAYCLVEVYLYEDIVAPVHILKRAMFASRTYQYEKVLCQ